MIPLVDNAKTAHFSLIYKIKQRKVLQINPNEACRPQGRTIAIPQTGTQVLRPETLGFSVTVCLCLFLRGWVLFCLFLGRDNQVPNKGQNWDSTSRKLSNENNQGYVKHVSTRIYALMLFAMGFPAGSNGKEYVCNARALGSIPGLARSPGEGNGNPLQYSCLENPMDRGGWRTTVHRKGFVNNQNAHKQETT